jgi:molybdenum cofactor guanylyltransferase
LKLRSIVNLVPDVSEPISPTSLSTIILAGGQSLRMGRDKAKIEIDGVPLLRRIYDVVAACESLDAIYVVTPWLERYRSILPDDCNFILEQPPHQGPLVAFSQALAEITSEWVLLLACDLPNLSTPIIQAWIARLPAVDSQSIAYLPRHIPKGWEPLCGFYRQNCHESSIEYIENGGQSFQDWLKMNIVTELAIADPLWLANCNTPADLELLFPQM